MRMLLLVCPFMMLAINALLSGVLEYNKFMFIVEWTLFERWHQLLLNIWNSPRSGSCVGVPST